MDLFNGSDVARGEMRLPRTSQDMVLVPVVRIQTLSLAGGDVGKSQSRSLLGFNIDVARLVPITRAFHLIECVAVLIGNGIQNTVHGVISDVSPFTVAFARPIFPAKLVEHEAMTRYVSNCNYASRGGP
ncbi:hypothetical protein WT10_21255 [Burkholderia stagnalis]|nr:hypothetical protein WS59_19525 [Burkholderia stagnalis]KVN16468.1 hypothetical protein WT10_21255 [Burkholderia stagnalis]KWK64979.1 hypothetical protein WT82_20345 [Burkholderia stagnalis]